MKCTRKRSLDESMHTSTDIIVRNLQIIPEDAYLESITPVLAVRDHVMNLCRILFLIGVIRMGIVRVGMKIDITARNPADAEMLKVRLDTGVTLGELVSALIMLDNNQIHITHGFRRVKS